MYWPNGNRGSEIGRILNRTRLADVCGGPSVFPLSRRVHVSANRAHVAPAAHFLRGTTAGLRSICALRCRRPCRLIDRSSDLVANSDINVLPSQIADAAINAISPRERGVRDGRPAQAARGPVLNRAHRWASRAPRGPLPDLPTCHTACNPPVRQELHCSTAPGPVPLATASSPAAASRRYQRLGQSHRARSPLNAATGFVALHKRLYANLGGLSCS